MVATGKMNVQQTVMQLLAVIMNAGMISVRAAAVDVNLDLEIPNGAAIVSAMADSTKELTGVYLKSLKDIQAPTLGKKGFNTFITVPIHNRFNVSNLHCFK